MLTPPHDGLSALQAVLLEAGEGVILRVYVQPKARKEQLVGLHGGRLKVSVTEPPDRGKANDAVVQLIASVLRTAPSNVALLRGQISRQKDLLIRQSNMATIRDLLAEHLQ